MDAVINLSKFKSIPGFSRYMISEYGDIYSIPRKRILSVSKNWAGYLTVTITDDSGFRSPRKVHRLVYLTYIGPLDPDLVIDHIDNNILNNHYSNLQQITPSENSSKSFISGKNNEKVVWTKDMVDAICRMMTTFTPEREIFKHFNVDYDSNKIQCNMLIGQLKRGQIHKDVASKYNLSLYVGAINRKDVKLSIEDVRNIYMCLRFGDHPADLARKYNVGFSSVCKIRDKITWRTLTDQIDIDYFE